MVRRVAGSFVFLAALAVAACGRQVTPEPTSGTSNLAGKAAITFRTSSAVDYQNLSYVVVFNTTGAGGEPYANAFTTSFTNYSYSFTVGAAAGGNTALPSLLQYYLVPGGSNQLQSIQIAVDPSLTQLVPNFLQQPNQFQLIFDRRQLSANALQTAAPAVAPAGPGVAGAAPVPGPSPTSAAQATWYVNFFTVDRSGNVQDALGFGPSDTSFIQSFNTQQSVNVPLNRPAGITPPSNGAAFITGGNVQNFP